MGGFFVLKISVSGCGRVVFGELCHDSVKCSSIIHRLWCFEGLLRGEHPIENG